MVPKQKPMKKTPSARKHISRLPSISLPYVQGLQKDCPIYRQHGVTNLWTLHSILVPSKGKTLEEKKYLACM